MLFKQGVYQFGLCKPMDKFLAALDEVAPDFVVTSTTGDKHQRDSRHYSGHAADTRRRTFHGKTLTLELLRAVARKVERDLGARPGSFDIIEYDWGFHTEWDPKG